jgi:hypothetical protein
MDRLGTTTATNRGSNNDLQHGDFTLNSSSSQRQRILAWLQQRPLTTLEARQELCVMSIAARIFELKDRGHNIVTHKVLAGKRFIAQYVLLVGGVDE